MRNWQWPLGVVAALVFQWGPHTLADAPGKSLGTLHVFAVAVNQAGVGKKDGTIDEYNWCASQFVAAFQNNSDELFASSSTAVMKGSEATKPALMGHLRTLARQARAKDLVVMYIGMHGGTDPKEGWVTSLADENTITGKEVKELLGQIPCQVVCVVETCGSGGFARDHKEDVPLPPNVTALCACRAKKTATNEMSIAFIEAINGRADLNADGLVQLPEIARYVRLRYQSTFAKNGDECVVVMAREPDERPLIKVNPRAVAVCHDGEWYSGVLLGKTGDTYKIRCDGFDSRNENSGWFLTNSVTRDNIVLPGEGKPMMVEQGGSWWAARLVEMQGKKFKVKYVGYDETEVVGAERVKYPVFITPGAEIRNASRKKK